LVLAMAVHSCMRALARQQRRQAREKKRAREGGPR
jgi:hypothetical protein